MFREFFSKVVNIQVDSLTVYSVVLLQHNNILSSIILTGKNLKRTNSKRLDLMEI